MKWNVEHISDPNHGPLFFIPQAEITSHSRRALTPVERRVTVYLALIHGAKSMIYFVSPIRHRATAENMKELSAEIRTLAPSLLRRRVEQEIDVTPAPEDGCLPIVQACAVERPEGGLLLLAANSSMAPVDAAWDFSALGQGARASDFFSGEAVDLSNGELRERYEGYATRVYLLEGGSRKAGERVVVRVALAGPALAKTEAEPEPEATNLVADPGFDAPQGNWTVVGKGAAFVAEGRDGTQCIKVTKAEPMGAVRIQMAKPFALKPATRCRFGAWVKSDLEQGQSPVSLYLSEAGWQELPKGAKPRLSAGKPAEPTAGQWRRIAREIGTPDVPGLRGELWLQVPYGTTGKIWIDNVSVAVGPLTRAC